MTRKFLHILDDRGAFRKFGEPKYGSTSHDIYDYYHPNTSILDVFSESIS